VLAKRLGIDPGQVRRILSQAGLTAKRKTRGTAIPEASIEVASTDEIKERIANYLAETSGTDSFSVDVLRSTILEHMTRGPHPIEDVVAVLNEVHAAPTPRGWFRPFDLARELNANPSTVRAALVGLRGEGRAEHDPTRAIGEGRWRMIDRPEGYDERDVVALIPGSREEQDRIGLRIFQDGDRTWVVAFDPGKDYGDGPSGQRRSHHKRIKEVGPGNASGRALAVSWDGRRYVPVLSTPLDVMTVVDRDDGPAAWIDPAAFGYAPTPSGHHAYLDPRFAGEHQDEVYERMSLDRSAWHERLFNSDGSRRAAPRPVFGTIMGGELARHSFAFLEAQEEAEKMRYA
jgi:hypothetical protein